MDGCTIFTYLDGLATATPAWRRYMTHQAVSTLAAAWDFGRCTDLIEGRPWWPLVANHVAVRRGGHCPTLPRVIAAIRVLDAVCV
jgi:hypothetical protein